MTLEYKEVLSHEVPFLGKNSEVRFSGKSYISKQNQVLIFEVITFKEVVNKVTNRNLNQFHQFFTKDFF